MTALLAPRPHFIQGRPMDERRKVILSDIPWQSYKAIRNALPDRRIFLTYDKGILEIMTLSSDHERFKPKLSMLVQILARFFRKNFECFGSFTQQREDLEKGVEADDCYYFESLPAVMGKRRIDLETDPAPDLALEVDVSHSSLDRMKIYAALRIGEVWRFDGRAVTVYLLKDGQYVVSLFSPTFPGIPIKELARFILLGLDKGDMVMWERFEKWLKKFASGPATPKRRKK